MQTADAGQHAGEPSARSRDWKLFAFPAVLWFIATLFYLGDIGLWNDDWFYVQRIPETGAVRALVLDRPIHFWRPLYRVVVPALATLLSDHTRILHLIGALAHGLNASLLYILLAGLGIRRLPATIGALCFLVFPWDTEPIFWACDLPTSLSVSLVLFALCIAARPATSRVRIAAAAFGLTFLACCLNEQPAPMALALPLVFVAAYSAGPGGWRASLRRTILLLVAPAVAIVLYTGLAHWTVGAAHGMISPSRWPATILDVGRWTASEVSCTAWLRRSWSYALSAAAEHPLRASLLAIALLATMAVWIARMSSVGGEQIESRRIPIAHPCLLAIGAVLTLAPLGPIVAFAYWLNPRVLYPSAIGLGFLLAVALSALASRSLASAARGRRVLLSGILAPLFGAGALAMVGVQHAYRQRDLLDRDVFSAFRELFPDPVPGSVFVPVRVDAPSCPPHAYVFDAFFWSVFNSRWSAGPALRLAYTRSDLQCGFALWNSTAWRKPSSDSVRVTAVTRRASWEIVIPFELDAHNNIHLITTVRFTTPSGEESTVAIAQTTALASQGRIPFNTWTFPPSADSSIEPGQPARDHP